MQMASKAKTSGPGLHYSYQFYSLCNTCINMQPISRTPFANTFKENNYEDP